MDQEKIQILCTALQSTLSPSQQERENAEVQLARFQTVPGYTVSLFQIVNSPEVNPAIRQSGSILFKNLVKARWAKPPENNEPVIFPEETKRSIKETILTAICSSPNYIRVQLGLCLTEIVIPDFPQNWPGLIPQCLTLINSQNPAYIEGAVFTLRMVAKRYEYCAIHNERREELHKVVEQILPTIYQLLKYLMTLNTLEAVNMQVLVVKLFWSATQLGMPPFLVNQERFTEWLVLLLQLLERPIQLSGEPQDAEDREKWAPWVLKKWVATFFDRLFQRYGVERIKDTDANKEFSRIFMSSFVLKLLESVLNVLTGSFARVLPRKLRTALLNYLNNSVYSSTTWVMVKPHLDKIFQSVLFPTLIWSSSDLELYRNDPHEYIRQQFDFVAEYSDPRNAVTQFMLDVVKLRGEQYLVIFMQFLAHNVLSRYLATPPENRNYAEKDAALVAIGNLAPLLKVSKSFKGSLEEMLAVHIIPELTSPVGFMRARAVWIFGQFYNITFQNEQAYLDSVQVVVHSINDKELPVRVYSALSLHFLVKSKLVKPKIEAILPQLLEAYLKLMGEIDNDDLVGALQTLIKKYKKQVANLAPAIATKLVEQYIRLIGRGNELFEDEDQTGMLTAMQLLKAFQTLLNAVKKRQDVMAVLQPLIRNLLLTIGPGLVDVFTDYIQILAMYTFFMDKIAPDTWDVFVKFADCFLDWANDYADEILIPFDNFISKDTETFLSNPLYLQKICQMYKVTVDNPDKPETDGGSICTLMEVVIVYCSGRVDGIIPEVLRIAVTRLPSAELPPFKVLLLEVFANCLLYNPMLALSITEANGWTQNLFALWFQLLNEHFSRLHDIKLTILAFVSLLKVPFVNWPNSLKGELKNILCSIMELIAKYTKMKEEREAKYNEEAGDNDIEEDGAEGNENAESEDSDSDSDIEEDIATTLGDLEDDDGTIERETAEVLENLTKENGNMTKVFDDDEDVLPAGMDGEALDKAMSAYYGDDDEFDLEDDDEFEVKTDQIDEVVFFCEAFSGFSQREPQVLAALISVLSDLEKEKLNQLAQEANRRVAKKATDNSSAKKN